ncbi:MAG: WG repeat-containing protein [Bacteroidales bacterium]|nr:WG repeat-containing protein [Bacteroidales bacterium]
MKSRSLLLCLLAVLLALPVAAQDLKPVRDKQTRKYGYQAKDKTWVIEPRFDDATRFKDGFAEVTIDGRKGLIDTEGTMILPAEYDDIKKFDKNGLCEVIRKVGKTKLHGVANQRGQIIVPVDCHSIHIPKNGGLITVQRESVDEMLAGMLLWGAYDMDGREIFPPQFVSSPSFSDGTGIAESVYTGLKGVVSDTGETLLPFEFLAIAHSGSRFRTLGTDFTLTTWDASFRRSEIFQHPGSVIPYDPMSDPVRAAAWHSGPVGQRLHRNQVKLLEMRSSRSGLCSDLRLDWGYDRFVRLEPFVDENGVEGAMVDPVSGNLYTLKALLYEADGTLVGEIARWGWLEAQCYEGAVYVAEGQDRWLVMKDPNALAAPSFSLTLSGYRTLDNSDVIGGLGLSGSELERLRDPERFNRRLIAIIEGENVGVTSYLPPETSLSYVRKERDAMRDPIFQTPFRMGDVVSCNVRSRKEEVEVELYDHLTLRFEDHFSDPYYSMSGEETIFWGPNNARTVRLSLKRVYRSSDATADDVHGTEECYHIVLSLYEEDGTWLRTLAEAPWVDFIHDGVLVFEREKIAVVMPRHDTYRTVHIPAAARLPHTLSALEQASRDNFGHKKRR